MKQAAPTPATLGLPGHASPAVGFEVPLEMLAACHGRIQDRCDTLRRLVPHVARHGADGPARDAAAAVIRYFETAARDHHADEESDLFPALIESVAGSDPVCVRQLTQSLVGEHRELERAWARMKPMLDQVVGGDPAALDADEVAAFVVRYERHITREDEQLLPMARRLLGDDELDRIGRAMRERRGVAV